MLKVPEIIQKLSNLIDKDRQYFIKAKFAQEFNSIRSQVDSLLNEKLFKAQKKCRRIN